MSERNRVLAGKKSALARRAAILLAVRTFFTERGYLEVETPFRIPANAPEAHIDPVTCGDWTLHTSPEIAMKRMLAAGYEQIFQLCRVWRDQERGQKHLPEFTILEWYRTGVDYYALMTECEELLQSLVPVQSMHLQGREIDLSSPWEKLSVSEAFSRYASKSLHEAIAEDLFEVLLTSEVEPNLGTVKPTFLTEYPASMAALARISPGNPEVAERFELYVNGLELANAFSELNDPQEQRNRFEQDEKIRRANGKPPLPLPERFLSELETMPEAAGIALGIDRLIMLLTDANRIDEVVTFTPEEL